MKRRFPLSRKRPRIIPPRRQHHQSPVLVCEPVEATTNGTFSAGDVETALIQLGFRPMMPIGHPWFGGHTIRGLVRNHCYEEGLPDHCVKYFFEDRRMRISITRPPTRPALISPKLAAFFGWNTPSTTK